MVTSFVGIGSNVGDRRDAVHTALELLGRSKDITVEHVSTFYETEPVGGPPGQGMYINGVIKLATSLSPLALLQRLQAIERRLKRRRTVKDGPRIIDLDILTYGEEIVIHPRLMIPHPRLDEREFVLRGFCEIAPDFIHPHLKMSIRDIYEALQEKRPVYAYDQEHTTNGSMH